MTAESTLSFMLPEPGKLFSILQKVGEINEIVTKMSYFMYKSTGLCYYSGNEWKKLPDSPDLQAFAF